MKREQNLRAFIHKTANFIKIKFFENPLQAMHLPEQITIRSGCSCPAGASPPRAATGTASTERRRATRSTAAAWTMIMGSGSMTRGWGGF